MGGRRAVRAGRDRRGQRGAVTAETVMVLPLLVAVTLALCWLVGLGVQQARTVDAARETARLLARDVGDAEAVAAGRAVAPDGARIEVGADGDRVRVRVVAPVAGPDVLGWVVGGELSATAVAGREEQ
ncbi:pilus assembly protein [Nocardioides zeae]|uniref:Pilus assembly protein n=1 Tax=Nocardioides imazamoxiresistens TaxID=3231893 RepID=A0ABU3PZR5_9ACTN|nr:pilus assembly protein [Nocardioides zeae]MDT9594763.1 pilus assembly protein [Nocardioides zeae]